MKLKNGKQASWMSIADEGSSAHLKAVIGEEYRMAELKIEKAIKIVNDCFEKWGLPKQIKIDNGWPFVHPGYIDLPTYAKLWWIGLGIKVIQNTPRCPQENGIVECLQGIMCSWTGPGNQESIEALQQRINEESDFQRNAYQIPSKGNQTRLELYPELMTNKRKYDPEKFDMTLVYRFLSENVWVRRVYAGGTVKMFGVLLYVGSKFKHFDVTVTFDPINICWLIRKKDGTLLNTSTKGIPTEEDIRTRALAENNLDTT